MGSLARRGKEYGPASDENRSEREWPLSKTASVWRALSSMGMPKELLLSRDFRGLRLQIVGRDAPRPEQLLAEQDLLAPVGDAGNDEARGALQQYSFLWSTV